MTPLKMFEKLQSWTGEYLHSQFCQTWVQVISSFTHWMKLTDFDSEPKCLAIMVAANLCNDSKVPKFLKNLHGNNEQNCLWFTSLKQELQELLTELKTAIKIHNTPKDETECGVNLVKECTKCNSLLFQLQKAIMKLKVTHFINKILHDELNKSGDTQHVTSMEVIDKIFQNFKKLNDKHCNKARHCSHIQVITTSELSTDMMCYQKYILNQMKSWIKHQW